MKSILKLMIPVLCCLSTIACKNNRPVETTENQEGTPPEKVNTIQGMQIAGGEDFGPYTLFIASTFKATDHSKQLKKLPFYEAPAPSATADDEPHMPDQINSLFPLGWSEAGHFAYATLSVGYSGEHRIHYTLRNMGTGDTSWEKEFTYAMVDDTAALYSEMETDKVILIKGGETDEELFRYAWMVNENEVLPVLEDAGIQFDPSVDFQVGSHYGDIQFEVKQVPGDDETFTEFTLNSNKFDPKVIYSDYFGMQPNVAGVIKSPFREIIVVVCSQKQTLFEMENEVVPLLTGYPL